MLSKPELCSLCGRFSRGEPKCRDHTEPAKRAFVKLEADDE